MAQITTIRDKDTAADDIAIIDITGVTIWLATFPEGIRARARFCPKWKGQRTVWQVIEEPRDGMNMDWKLKCALMAVVTCALLSQSEMLMAARRSQYYMGGMDLKASRRCLTKKVNT